MKTPTITERHMECAKEIIDSPDDDSTWVAEIIAKHFPEDGSWAERAAEEIMRMSTVKTDSSLWEKKHRRIIEIINGCRRG